MADFDCLLIGHNELDFQQYYGILENMASSGGRDHVAFTDLQLNHIRYDGRPQQGLDLLTTLYNEDRLDSERREFYNGDCLWTAIAYLGSYLAQRGYTFDFVNLFHREQESLKQKLRENRYALIVLTGTMYVFEQNIWEVIAFIRKHAPDARIVAGGPYISKQAEEREPEYMKPLFRYLNADFYCYVREGEQTLVRLLDALKSGQDPATVPNLAFKRDNDFVITPKEREVNPLESNMIDYPRFADAYRPSGWANVRISDGCPYACGFCAFPEHGNERYVLMSLDRIERELDSIHASGAISHIFFIDATMNVPRKKFKEILRLMIRKQYGLKWHCFFRCDQTDEETIWLMRDAGCIGVFLGLESANATVLRNMDKTAHKEDFYRTLPWFKAAGLRQMVSVLVGFPGETIETFRETLDFIEEVQPDFTRIQTWYCDPTTPIWFKREKFGLQGKGYGWKHDTMDSETAVELVVDAFLSLRNVSWVPDPGYNWTAIYAMEKLGMSIERQKSFFELFAAAAKAQMLSRYTAEPDRRLLDALRASARFDDEVEPDLAAAEPLRGERYLAARAFWVDQLRGGGLSPGIDAEPTSGAQRTSPAIATARWSHVVPSDIADHDGVLTAYRLVLDRIEGLDGALLVALEEGETFPLRLGPTTTQPALDFDDERRRTAALVRDAQQHQLFAWHIVTHPLTAKEFGVALPPLRAAYLADHGDVRADAMRRRWRFDPAVIDAIDIVLTVAVADNGEGLRLELLSATGRFDDDLLADVGRQLLDILGVVAALAASADGGG